MSHLNNIHNKFIIVTVLLILLACGETEQKAKLNETGLEKAIRANAKGKEVMTNALKTGNTGQDMANWLPETMENYIIDDESIEIDKKNLPWAKAVYKHPTNPESNITLNIWDGQGAFAMAVNTMKTAELDAQGEDDNGQIRKKVYVRNNRKSSEMVAKQSGLVHIIFEAEQRFYVTMRSPNNSLATMWQLADELDFTSLIK